MTCLIVLPGSREFDQEGFNALVDSEGAEVAKARVEEFFKPTDET